MKASHVVALSLAAAFAALAIQAAQAQDNKNVREDDYVRKVPLEDFKVPIRPDHSAGFIALNCVLADTGFRRSCLRSHAVLQRPDNAFDRALDKIAVRRPQIV